MCFTSSYCYKYYVHINVNPKASHPNPGGSNRDKFVYQNPHPAWTYTVRKPSYFFIFNVRIMSEVIAVVRVPFLARHTLSEYCKLIGQPWWISSDKYINGTNMFTYRITSGRLRWLIWDLVWSSPLHCNHSPCLYCTVSYSAWYSWRHKPYQVSSGAKALCLPSGQQNYSSINLNQVVLHL